MTPHSGHPITVSEVIAAADRLITAFRETDTAAYFSCFDESATFFFHTEPALLPDRAAYEALWDGWIADGWRVVSCESTGRDVVILGDTAVFSHSVRTMTSVDGVDTCTVERESIVYARTGDALIAVHEHLSDAEGATL